MSNTPEFLAAELEAGCFVPNMVQNEQALRVKAAAELLRLAAVESERDKLRAEVETLRADAERYRWLRDKARSVDWTQDINGWSWEQHCRIGGQGMDADIDAAMKGKP